MQFKLIALAAFMATGVLAAPNAGAPCAPCPPPPPPVTTTKTKTVTVTATPTSVAQSNTCGNGATPYCCTAAEKGGYSVCGVLDGSSQCSQTTVCCNANNVEINVCLGGALIL